MFYIACVHPPSPLKKIPFTDFFGGERADVHRLCKTLAFTAVSTYSKLKDDVFHSVTQAYSEKENENPSASNRSRTYDLPIASSDALLLSYRRLVVARPLN